MACGLRYGLLVFLVGETSVYLRVHILEIPDRVRSMMMKERARYEEQSYR